MTTESYISPIGTRYKGVCSRIWSEEIKRRLWRYHWLNSLEILYRMGILDDTDDDIGAINRLKILLLEHDMSHQYKERVKSREAEIGHDIVAELEVFQEQVSKTINSSRLHAVQTSSNIKDMAFIVQTIISLHRISELAHQLVGDILGVKKDGLMQGRTHLQKADITTYKYRMTVYATRIMDNLNDMVGFVGDYEATKHPYGLFGGPTGTYGNLVEVSRINVSSLRKVRSILRSGDPSFQTYDRSFDLKTAQILSRMGSTLYKLAQDLRLMLAFGDLRFVNRKDEIQGSSSLPTKENPIFAEKACALLRHLPALEREIWDYSSHSMLERTLDDSAVRRYALPEMFQAMEEAIQAISKEVQSVEYNDETKIDLSHSTATRVQSLIFAKGYAGVSREFLSRVDWSDKQKVKNLLDACGITYPDIPGYPHHLNLVNRVATERYEQFRMPRANLFSEGVKRLTIGGYQWL